MDKTIENEGYRWLQYEMQADLLCIGESMRGSVYRPCLEVVPCTTLAGAFKARFPHQNRRVYAACHLLHYQKNTLTYAPRERHAGYSKIPLQIEHLVNVTARVFIQKNDWTKDFPESFELHMGALKQQGFGLCRFQLERDLLAENPTEGTLAVRLLDNDTTRNAYQIRNPKCPRYGYLFVPDHGMRGHYERALFEGSVVVADPVVLKPDENSERLLTNNDPIEPVLKAIQANDALRKNPKKLKSNFCHNVAQVFEAHGAAVTRLYLLDKSEQRDTKEAAKLLLPVLEILEKHEMITQHRPIGRYILKTLPLLLKQGETS